jgi:hypothetical protein
MLGGHSALRKGWLRLKYGYRFRRGESDRRAWRIDHSHARHRSAAARQGSVSNDLTLSLEYLDNLRQMQDAVNAEIERRGSVTATRRPTRSANQEAVQIPQGQVNLIRASFTAGLKPAAIARTLGISQSLVRRVLKSNANP